LGILLSSPLAWLGLAHLGALAALFVTEFWTTDVFTGQVVVSWSLSNFATLFRDAVYRTVTSAPSARRRSSPWSTP
jgi:putative spermidine/putrescine transport system permease protein